jgi:uncharacterized protein YdhG (YjbR/CyaY superfamily)
MKHVSKIAPSNVDGYIATFPQEVKQLIEGVRKAIKEAAPDAEEMISYGMPAYKQNGILAYFAAYKNHIGFYAMPTGHQTFKRELSAYKTGKGSVQFPLDKPLPLGLITTMVKFRVKENIERVNLKAAVKNKNTH